MPDFQHQQANMSRTPQIAVVTQPQASSGLGHYIARALQQQGATVDIVDCLASKSFKLWPVLKSLRMNPDSMWRARWENMLFSSWAWNRNSRRNAKLLQKFCRADTRVLVIGKEYFPHPVGATSTYDVYILYTMKLALADGVTPWLPPVRDRASFLALETAFYRNARQVFTGGNYVKPHLVNEYGVDPKRIVVAGGGVHPFYLDHIAQDIPRLWQNNLIFVGWDFGMKGGKDLLVAFSKIRAKRPETTLTVVGPDASQHVAQDGVIWKGPVQSKAELISLYRASDLFIMPSLRDSFGFVFLEAMSQGVPCVGANLNAMPEIVQHGQTGYIVPLHDPSALAQTILDYYAEPANRMRMGHAAQERVLKYYTWNQVALTLLSNSSL